MRPRSSARFALRLVRTNLRASMALRGAFLVQCLLMILNNAIFFTFWWLLFRRVPDLRGWRLHDVSMLFGIAASGFGLAVALLGGVRTLSLRITEGELDVWLTQPRDPLVQALASRSIASGWGDLVSGLTLLALSGHVDAPRVLPVALAIALSCTVVIAMNAIYQSLAFWLGRIDALTRTLLEMQATFSTYPEPLFGGPLRLLLFTAIPAGFISHLPASLVRDPSLRALAIAAGGALGFALLARAVFRAGLRRYASGSRFALRI
jgi:ABC-2 type transport system permease protein